MVRPKKDRLVGFNPKINYFKPRGIPVLDLEEVCLTVDERESIRLADLEEMSHESAGSQMAFPGRLLAGSSSAPEKPSPTPLSMERLSGWKGVPIK